MYFDMSNEEVRSFEMSHFRFTMLAGPARYVRFSDSGRGASGRLGRFWMHGSDIAALLAKPGSGFDLIRRVSDTWAICDDWGDKKLMWVLTIPKGAEIPAAVGKAAFQPAVSAAKLEAQRAMGPQARGQTDLAVWWLDTGESYAGRGLQYVIPVKDDNHVENVALSAMIGLSQPTYKVAADPGRFLG